MDYSYFFGLYVCVCVYISLYNIMWYYFMMEKCVLLVDIVLFAKCIVQNFAKLKKKKKKLGKCLVVWKLFRTFASSIRNDSDKRSFESDTN